MTTDRPTPQIKICGLTKVSEAQACAAMGASAIGCVFYPPSPRNLTLVQARRICEALPPETVSVGVFANAAYDHIVQTVSFCSLKAVQLHGQEPPALIAQLQRAGLTVYKTLFNSRPPFFSDADQYQASAYLVECGQGRLPGGNAEAWNWQEARDVARAHPLILAGGLAPENVAAAIALCEPDAVDVSSSVEAFPGRKNLNRVKAFIDQVAHSRIHRNIRRIFL